MLPGSLIWKKHWEVAATYAQAEDLLIRLTESGLVSRLTALILNLEFSFEIPSCH